MFSHELQHTTNSAGHHWLDYLIMRYPIRWLWLVVTVIVIGCASSPRAIQNIEGDVRRYVPAGWSISTSNNIIRICSNQKVALIGRISRPAFTPIEELAERFGMTTKYEVTLTFVPLLSANQYSRLKAKRAPFLYTLDHGAGTDGPTDGKTLYGQAMKGYSSNPVPMFFTKDYSIYVDRPIDRFVETYPPNTRVQADVMLIGFRNLFMQYEE